MRDPEKLKVFQMAELLALSVYEWLPALPEAEKYALSSQIRRSAASVPANLVEGCSRDSQADFRRFVEIALGSAMELRFHLRFAMRVYSAVIPFDEKLIEEANQVVGALVGFKKALRSEL